jgi:hypothetical protein
MISKLKDRARRHLGIGIRTKDVAPLGISDSTEMATTVALASILPESPVTPNTTSGTALNNNWNNSTASLPILSLGTEETHKSHALDDNVRPAIDGRHATTKGKSRGEVYLWSGLKTLSEFLESSTEAFAPLKSAISGLKWWIDLYEVRNFTLTCLNPRSQFHIEYHEG